MGQNRLARGQSCSSPVHFVIFGGRAGLARRLQYHSLPCLTSYRRIMNDVHGDEQQFLRCHLTVALLQNFYELIPVVKVQ
ncbi:hypothetical protein PanWU01x14_362530 [Parasponia andersonii]|uniref:Uncharacterized protein n=1 Tax=Parasponia andersonii TaxID=3476 RepID=A0A2P5A6Z4_PARAD|nr:hypothetical protein PanWU01x14_362530 [Parasponia andersonii]